MRRYLLLAAAVVAVIGTRWAFAESQYPLSPQAGEWMILIQSYTSDARHGGTPGAQAQLADDLAATLRRDYRLPAYVHNRGEEERQKERARIAAIKKQREELAKAQNLPKDTKWEPIRTHKIEDSYGVLVGGWKDMEAAREALEKIRKLKPPPEKFMHQGEVVPAGDTSAKKADARERIYGGYNPFLTAFVVHNPLLPPVADTNQGKLENLREYNADESFSLLKCKKPYTLMVKPYQGGVTIASAAAPKTSVFEKLGGSKNPGGLLNASANQAHELAKVLKQMPDTNRKPMVDVEVYVLHTEFGSYVCVGGFDRPDDPMIKFYQKKLAGLKVGPEQLALQPMPMPVPKP